MKKMIVLLFSVLLLGILFASPLGPVLAGVCVSLGISATAVMWALGALIAGFLVWILWSERNRKWVLPVILATSFLFMLPRVQAQSVPPSNRECMKLMALGSLGSAVVKGALASAIGCAGAWTVFKAKEAFDRWGKKLKDKYDQVE